jgi:hypothetical protein
MGSAALFPKVEGSCWVVRWLKSISFAVAWLLLTSTAVAKLASAAGTSPVLDSTEEVTGLRVRTVMVGGSVLELLVCAVLLLLRSGFWRGLCILSLAIQFELYHLARLLMGVAGPCPCLGTAWKWVPWVRVAESDVARAGAWFASAIALCGMALLLSDPVEGGVRAPSLASPEKRTQEVVG